MPAKTSHAYKLDSEEKELSAWLDKAALKKTIKSVPGVKQEIKRITKIAKENGNTNKSVKFSLTETDFHKAQEIARQEGIPYEAFLSGVCHRYLSGRLVEKRAI